MKKLSFAGIFLRWLRVRVRIIAMLIFFAAVTMAVTLLYHGNLKAVAYSEILCAFFSVCAGIFDFIAFYRTYIKLYVFYSALEVKTETDFTPNDFLSEESIAVIEKLCSERNEIMRRLGMSGDEARDYYTLWTHQIKTPISAMRLLLENGGEDSTELMKAELFRIERYAEMALCYIRTEKMNEDLRLKKHRIYDITGMALKKYAPLFIRSGLSLEFDEFALEAVTDEKWLAFVIEQLLSNCIKYTRKGGVRIYTEERSLVISDSGIGISEEDLPRIFERGFTGFNGRMDKKATGLGLYLCKKICGTLGHKLSVSSQVGKGTAVRIDFTQENAM